MSEQRSCDEFSRQRWGAFGGKPTLDELQVGCLQRIATATEAMALNYQKLIDNRDYYKHAYESMTAGCAALERTNTTLRGVITKLKKERS